MSATALHDGREAFAERRWSDAYDSLSAADRAGPLGADDLERLATAASLAGRTEEYLAALERVHHVHEEAGDDLRAARAAFWLAMTFATRGDMGPAAGWFARGQRLVERGPADCVGRGYLLIPRAFQ